MNIRVQQSGYIALVTALVLGMVIVLLAMSTALLNGLHRRGSLDASLKLQSDFMARSCMEQALLKLAKNSAYTGNETLVIGVDTCQIASIQIASPNEVLRTSSTVGNTSTHLKATVTVNGVGIVSFQEE